MSADILSVKGAQKGDAYMAGKIRDTVWVAVLSVICGLIIRHVFGWYMAGKYREMLQWIGTGKGYLTVLYNIILMLVLGIALGLLMMKISDLLGYKTQEPKHFDKDA